MLATFFSPEKATQDNLGISLLKLRVGNILAKAAALRITLNLDGAPHI